MKKFITLIIIICIALPSTSQNIGINTTNPQEDLHIKTDSTAIKVRLDSKRSTQGFIFQSTVLQPSGVIQNTSTICLMASTLNCVPWSNLTVARLTDEDDLVANTSDSIAPYQVISTDLTNELEVTFATSSIPTDAIVSGISVMVDYESAPVNEIISYGITGLSIGFTSSPLANPYYRILDGSDNELIEYPSFIMSEGSDQFIMMNEELDTPTAISSIGNLKLIVPSFIQYNSFDIAIGLDKMALKVDYYVPVTGEVNSPWKYGVIDGSFTIESQNQTPLSIKENGVTQIESLRIPNGAATGHILTSNKKGKASWKALPSDNDLDWRIQDDTLQNLAIPTKTNSKLVLSQGATLGNINGIPQAGDLRFNPATGIFEGFTGAKWVQFAVNSGWGSLLGEEQSSFEKAPPEFKSFGTRVGLRGDNAMAISETSMVFYLYDINTDSWSEVSEFLFDEKVFDADLFGDYAVATFRDSINIYHFSGSVWSKEYQHSVPYSSTGYLASLGNDSRLCYGINNAIIIMERIGSTWNPIDTLSTIDDLSSSHDDLELKGENLIFGHSGINNAGLAFHARLEFGNWNWVDTLKSPLNSSDANDDFGFDVSIGGSWLAIGARLALSDPDVGGRVYMYQFNGTLNKYDLKSILISPTGPENNVFGHNVDVSPSANYLAVADYHAEKVFVFERTGQDWNHTTSLTSSSDISEHRFPNAVQITNEHILAGIPVILIFVNDKPGKIYFYRKE